MENITLGEIVLAIAFILSFSGNITNLIKTIKSPIDKKLQGALEPVNKKIDNLDKKISNMEKEHMKKLSDFEIDSVKADLVNLMCLAEQGTISEEQKKLGHELFDVYTNAGRNSYVHDKWDKLVREGKI